MDSAAALCLRDGREARRGARRAARRCGRRARATPRRDPDRGAHAAAACHSRAVRVEGRDVAGPAGALLSGFCRAAGEACVLQLGGAAARCPPSAIAANPWPATSRGARPARGRHLAQRAGRFCAPGRESAILAGIAAKVARDVALLMQPEVGEASEPALAPDAAAPPACRTSATLRSACSRSRRPRARPDLRACFWATRARARARPRPVAERSGLRCASLSARPRARSPPWPRCCRGCRSMSKPCARTSSEATEWCFPRWLRGAFRGRRRTGCCEQAQREGRNLVDVMRADGEVARALSAGSSGACSTRKPRSALRRR